MATRKKKKALTLTQALSGLLEKQLLPDLAARAEQPSIDRVLRREHAQEKAQARTADAFAAFRQRTLEQVGAAWILSCVFVRTLEERCLLARERLAGEGAADSEQLFYELAPSLTARDYLLTVFREVASLPGAEALLGPGHNPAWRLSPSHDGARALLDFFRQRDAEGALRWRFDGDDTRFLGDLYQDLSEAVRKRYALLQTPHFVEAFILDHTLEPAIEEYGLEQVRVLDPTCGSGHFLLGAFERLLDHRLRSAPGVDVREHAQAALAQVYGVDVNPYAVAIARFRLTLAYLARCGFTQLAQAPKLELNLVVADSLLHGAKDRNLRLTQQEGAEGDAAAWDPLFALDDPAAARELFGQRYHAVVGNPPYITCKDAALREQYREAYTSAAGKYALAAPFTERFFQLAVDGGYVGMINANSFMKREFGKALIEKVLPRCDLTHVVDASGVPLPNHGATTTVILVGRNRGPSTDSIHVVGGKRKDTTAENRAAEGPAWTSILEHGHEIGFENDYVSVAEVPRTTLAQHPWSLGGGGAGELKEWLESRAEKTLGDLAASVGISSVTGEDEVYLLPPHVAEKLRIERVREMLVGEGIRDWGQESAGACVFPYDDNMNLLPIDGMPSITRHLWKYRAILSRRKRFGVPMVEKGLSWYELQELYADKLRTPLSITFAEVVSHNHFVLDRGGKVFKQTAPIIKLPEDATEDDHLALLAYLNSSTACFWMKQVCFNKGSEEGLVPGLRDDAIHMTVDRGTTGGGGNYQFAGTALKRCPILLASPRLMQLVATADQVGKLLQRPLLTRADLVESSPECCRDRVEERRPLIRKLVRLQEEMDWEVYRILGLVAENIATEPSTDEMPIAAGERPFEVAMARQYGDGSKPVYGNDGHPMPYDLPAEWPSAMRDLWERRIRVLGERKLGELETAKHKRRWRPRDDEAAFNEAAHALVLEEFEETFRTATSPGAVGRHAAAARLSTVGASWLEFLGCAQPEQIMRLLERESLPFLGSLCYQPTGLEKHAAWKHTWDLQRREDAGEAVGDIPVPPKYTSKDFRSPHYWRLRGKLDVPKERFISYPGCEKDGDPSPLIGWAGWNHLQRAQALIALYQERKLEDGWETPRLMPMLVGLHELMFWLELWHSGPEAGSQNPAREITQFLDSELSGHRLTVDDLEAWRPPEKATSRGRKKREKS